MLSTGLLSRGALTISIDVQLPTQAMVWTANRDLDSIAGPLIDAFNCYRLPATWGLADPARSPLVARLRQLPGEHEVAVLGEAAWLGSPLSRADFGSELSRRVLAARAAGLSISTLMPSGAILDDHLDVVLKYEISAVRGVVDVHGRAARPAQPNPLHYGLWEVPAALSLPGSSHWLPGGGLGWKARRQIDRAATNGTVFHLVIDAAAFATAGASALKTLHRVLRHAEHRLDDRRIDVLTLAALAERLSPPRRGVASKSILRTAC